MAKRHAPVEIRVRKPNADGIARIQKRFPAFFVRDEEDFVFRSALEPSEPVSDHLKWLHCMLQFEGRVFRQLEAAGMGGTVIIRAPAHQLQIEPEALLLAHKLHLKMEVRFSQ